MTEQNILQIIQQDTWMIEILKTVKQLNLPDWWIGAGFVRGKVWDYLHGYTERTPLPDIDVIYFDRHDFAKEEMQKDTTTAERRYEKMLSKIKPDLHWSVTNQARMHVFHNDQPYQTSEQALAQWVETATCIGVRLDKKDKLILTAPRGIDDLINLILRPTHQKNAKTFAERIKKKKWLTKWPRLRIAARCNM